LIQFVLWNNNDAFKRVCKDDVTLELLAVLQMLLPFSLSLQDLQSPLQ